MVQDTDTQPTPSPKTEGATFAVTTAEKKLLLRLRLIKNNGGGVAIVSISKEKDLGLYVVNNMESLGKL